jgi:anti-anti-sigma factor
VRFSHLATDGDGAMSNSRKTPASKQHAGRRALLTLSGEFDIRRRRALERTLLDCLAWGGSTIVDLSEVTFMDSWCLRELAVHQQLGGGRMILCDPSQDVLVGAVACDLEDWLDFAYTADPELPPGADASSISRWSIQSN